MHHKDIFIQTISCKFVHSNVSFTNLRTSLIITLQRTFLQCWHYHDSIKGQMPLNLRQSLGFGLIIQLFPVFLKIVLISLLLLFKVKLVILSDRNSIWIKSDMQQVKIKNKYVWMKLNIQHIWCFKNFWN